MPIRLVLDQSCSVDWKVVIVTGYIIVMSLPGGVVLHIDVGLCLTLMCKMTAPRDGYKYYFYEKLLEDVPMTKQLT